MIGLNGNGQATPLRSGQGSVYTSTVTRKYLKLSAHIVFTVTCPEGKHVPYRHRRCFQCSPAVLNISNFKQNEEVPKWKRKLSRGTRSVASLTDPKKEYLIAFRKPKEGKKQKKSLFTIMSTRKEIKSE